MATVTVQILPCQHIIFTATAGEKTKSIVMTRDGLIEEFMDDETAWNSLMVQIRALVREQRASGKTWLQVKMALEAAEFRV